MKTEIQTMQGDVVMVKIIAKNVTAVWSEGLEHMGQECPSTPLNENWREVSNTSNLPPRT